MNIKDIDFSNIKIDVTKEITPISDNGIDVVKKDPNPFVFTGCKGLMLGDFGAVTGNKAVGIGFSPIK
ncbi:hypothetical protein [Moorena sp. SIO3H5]|uniref:hypothetical protein n=1 Tax=Moorena sp. SIO3H5 TaxID=2607834 RepID=UPI0013BA88E6|nr:hypothetical protein [Moorena sp. SIO3H5]NEO71782.1 hypothetical protein [Moorena sp. SIO3H5]